MMSFHFQTSTYFFFSSLASECKFWGEQEVGELEFEPFVLWFFLVLYNNYMTLTNGKKKREGTMSVANSKVHFSFFVLKLKNY